MSRLIPRRAVAIDKMVADECTELWGDDAAPFYITYGVPLTCRFLADVLREFGFPAAIASRIQSEAAKVFGVWINRTPYVAANVDCGMNGEKEPILSLFIIDNGDTAEGGEEEWKKARKFAEVHIFLSVEGEE